MQAVPSWWFTLPGISEKVLAGLPVRGELSNLMRQVERAGASKNDRSAVERILHEQRIVAAMRRMRDEATVDRQ